MGEGFANSVVGGAETLIRSAVKSFGYIANVAGWRIARDGTADLNAVTLRGSMEVDGAGNSYIKILSSGGIPTFLIRSADQPGIASSDVYQAIIQNISWHPSGVGSSYQEFGIDGPAFSNGGGAANYDHADIRLTSPSYDGTQGVSASIQATGNAGTNPKLFDINLKGNVHITGKFSRPNCLLSSAVSPMASGTTANLLVGTVVRDTYSMFDGTSTVTIPTGQDGTYEVGMLGTYAAQAAAAGYRSVQIAKNGSTNRRMKIPATANLNNEIIGVNLVYELDMLAGETITFLAHQNSGAGLNFTGDMWVKQVENI